MTTENRCRETDQTAHGDRRVFSVNRSSLWLARPRVRHRVLALTTAVALILVSACVPTMADGPPRFLASPAEVIFEARALLTSPSAALIARGEIEIGRASDTMLTATVYRAGLLGGRIEAFEIRVTTSSSGDSTLMAVNVTERGEELRQWVITRMRQILREA